MPGPCERRTTGYLRLGVMGQMRREDTPPFSSAEPFPKTVTGAVRSYVLWNRSRFLVAQGMPALPGRRTLIVGTTVRFGLQVAPSAFGYERDGLGPRWRPSGGPNTWWIRRMSMALRTGYHLCRLDSGNGAGRRYRGTHKPAGSASRRIPCGRWLVEDPGPGEEFDLGLGSGPRAFGSHSFTGDRSFFTTVEYRYTMVG